MLNGMNWLIRLPGSRRAPSGLEWRILRAYPPLLGALVLAAAAGTLLVRGGFLHLEQQELFRLLGLTGFLLSALITLGIGCVLVVLMKGHGYVADAYPMPDDHMPD